MQEIMPGLKKQINLLTGAVIVSFVLVLMLYYLYSMHNENAGIIRAKGLVIEDSKGRDRILLGAPIPFSKDRVRTDSALVRKYWAKKYKDPEQFMQWYQDYYHATIGLVVMNENGFDRVLVGDKLADPNSGRRMFEATGITWNDPEGWERGGGGVNTTPDGKSRSAMGVDNYNGEAAHLLALEDGTNAIAISGDQGILLIGFSKKDGSFFQNTESFTGMKFFNQQGALIWEQKMNK